MSDLNNECILPSRPLDEWWFDHVIKSSLHPFYIYWAPTMTSEVKWKLFSCVQLFVTPGLYSPWNSPGQNTGVGSLSFLQGIFPTQGSNPGLSLCRWILYLLRLKGITRILEWVAYPFSRGSSWSRNQTRVSGTAGGFLSNWDIRQWPRHCFILFKKKSYWSMVDSQCCVSLRYTAKWTSPSPHIYIHIYIHSFSDSFPI